MLIDRETDDGSDESQNTEQDNAGDETEQTDLKAEVASLKDSLAQVTALLQAQANTPKAEPKEKKISKEEYDTLLKEDPKKAVQLAVDEQVRLSTAEIEKRLSQNQQIAYFDQKLESDFPNYKTDKKFRDAVQQEARDLVGGGMTKDSPKLMYKAAEIAALKYTKANEGGSKKESSGMSGEAPNTTRKAPIGDKHLPSNFERLARTFNLSDKAKEKAKEIFAHKAKVEQHRRSRGI